MDAGLRERRLYVPRYTAFQRVNHWITAVLFVLLALSGLALYTPWLYFLSIPFGGGETVRALHPWLGVALVVSFYSLAVRFWRNNVWNGDDVKWLKRLPSVAANDHAGLPEIGKYNAGQKGVYWSQILLIAVLFATGLAAWQVYFGHLVPIPVQRLALLLHAATAIIAITVIIVHIYAGIWIKGTGRAMTRGSVTGGWAYLHHRKWLRESIAKGLARPQSGLHGDE